MRGWLFFALLLSLAGGAGAEEIGVELVKSAPPPVAKGQRATVSLTLLPRAGNRILDDGPLVVHVSGDGVSVERALYRREDAVDPRAEAPRFELPFRAQRAGAVELRARCTFYLCRGSRCRPVDTEAQFHIDATP